jgi:succinoglycan biosynthesis transport protein ExoP
MRELANTLEEPARALPAQPITELGYGYAPHAHYQSQGSRLEMSVDQLFATLRRRKLTIIATFLVVTATAYLVLSLMTRQYAAEAIISVRNPQTDVLNTQSVLPDLLPDLPLVRTEVETLTSRPLAARVVDELRLDQDPLFNANLVEKTDLARWVERAEAAACKLLEKVVDEPCGSPETPEAAAARGRELAIDTLMYRLSVLTDGKSYAIDLTLVLAEYQRAKQVLTSIVDLYLGDQLATRLEKTKKAGDWLTRQTLEMRERLDRSIAALNEFRREHDILYTPTGNTPNGTIAAQQLVELGARLTEAEAEYAQTDARRHAAEAFARAPDKADFSEALESPLIQSLKQQEARLLALRARLNTTFGTAYPPVGEMEHELSEVRAKISAEADKILGSVRQQAAMHKRRIAVLQASFDSANVHAREVSRYEAQLGELQKEADANQQMFNAMLTRSNEIALQKETQESDARLVSPPEASPTPVFPKIKLMVSAAGLLALVLGAFVALVRESLERRFRSADQLEQLTGVPCLEIVPSLGRRMKRWPPPEHVVRSPVSAYAESLRALGTTIDLCRPPDGSAPRSLLITSSLPKEGKSTFAMSLASVLARSGRRILLIDADLRRPTIGDTFNLAPAAGLVEVVLGKADFANSITRDELTGLDILSVKTRAYYPQAVLGSAQMAELIRRLSATYDQIIVDSPPILAVSDSTSMARIMDAVLLVVRWNETPSTAVETALKKLRSAHANIVGTVLTQVAPRSHGHDARRAYGRRYREVSAYYGR